MESLQIDSLDSAILVQLQKDGRAPLSELGVELGVSHGTIRNHLDKLLAKDVVKVVAVPDPAKVGFPTQVLIGIDAELKDLESVERQLQQFEEVTFVAALTGRLDFLIGAVLRSDRHLREFLVRRLSSVKGIRDTETFHVLNYSKRIWEWRIPQDGQ